jgi:cellobiose phosphorylase
MINSNQLSRCGRFSANSEEYILGHRDLEPRQWLNYHWNSRFIAQTTSDGGGQSFFRHVGGIRTQLNRGPRRIYLRDCTSNDVHAFPTAATEVVFGQGYTTWRGDWQGVRIELQVSVADNLPAELWTVRLTGSPGQNREFDLIGAMQIDLSGYPTPFHITSIRSEYDSARDLLKFINIDVACTHPYFNGFAVCDQPVTHYDAAGMMFAGKGSFEAPGSLQNGGNLTDTPYGGYGTIAALQTAVKLTGNQSHLVRFVYGTYDRLPELHKGIAKLFAEPAVWRSGPTAAARARNERFLVTTPDAELNRLFNSWAKHNLQFCIHWTRIYSRGFRDVLQDAMGASSIDPDQSREKILAALGHVYRSGRCVRAWDAVNTLQDELYTDGPIWIPLALNAYLAETGDFALLDEVIPWHDGGEASVFDHLLAALNFLYGDRDERGLCRIHDGDWADMCQTLGRQGRGVGVWLTIALHNALNETSKLVQYLGKDQLVAEMQARAAEVKQAVNTHGWDGDWYLFAHNDENRAIGTAAAKEGRIFLNPQSWAVLSGLAEGERKQACLKAIDTELDSTVGPYLLAPAYTDMDAGVGSVTGSPTGVIENGSCYCHAAAFKIVADCVAGRGAQAYKTLRAIMPGGDADQQNENADCPPFAFTNSRAAMGHPYLAGRSLGLWITGTVAWGWVACTEWILGIRKTFAGLIIDPCIPADWDGFTVHRLYRGCTYEITVENPEHIEHGVREVRVDGEAWNKQVLPIRSGETVRVRVLMGKKKVAGASSSGSK